MQNNRFLVCLVLRCLCAERSEQVVECLDAFGASGVMGIQWMKSLPSRLKVHINEINAAACAWIQQSLALNDISFSVAKSADLTDDRCGPLESGCVLLNDDCNVVMLRKGFDFIHLDPFGSSCLHLESAFRNLRSGGILSITSTDAASLFSRNPAVVMRNYSAAVVKTEYVKEMAVRIVVSAAVRAAARCGKGVKVLFSVSSDHFLFVCLRVIRGCQQIDRSLAQLSCLLHCRLCEERSFLPAGQLAPLESPYSLLRCSCRAAGGGRTGVVLGPMWKGPIFCPDFTARLLSQASSLEVPSGLKTILRLAGEEAGASTASELLNGTEPAAKKSRSSGEGHPPFYFFPARMKLPNVDLPKIELLLAALSSRGVLCSRTHFEPTAIRADCSLAEIRNVILTLQGSPK